MLKEARDDLSKQTRQHEEEIQLLNDQLQNKRDVDFMRFKEFVERGGNPANFHGAPTTADVIIESFSNYFSYLFYFSVRTYS